MAGSITVSSITLDSDNNFSIRSNTGATILSANGTGLITGIASGSSITNAQLTTPTISSPTVSGNAAFDTNTLFVDATNDRVGIGTFTPAYTFDVTTSTTVLGRFQSTHSTGGYLYFQASGTTPTATGYIGAASKLNSGGANTDFGMTAVTNLVFGTNDGTERMRIDSSGRVTMPYQSGFAYIVAAVSVVGSNYILFSGGSYNYNVGSILNLTGGTSGSSRVTVPVSGYYDISVSIMGETDGSRIEMFVRKNGADVAGTNAVSTQYNNAHINGIFYLAAGDYLEIYKQSGTLYNSASSNNFFTVRLLG